jgi:ABC-type transport system substrate-binding protein
MNQSFGRRRLLGGGAVIAASSALPFDVTQAQTASGTLRVGMTASAVPLSNGVPDQGAEGHRFMGITLYDQLVMWDLSSFDKPAGIRPGLATAWRTDPADQKRWIITLREGVKFHDGKVMTAEDVVFSYDRAFKNDAPHFDNRAAAQARIRMPTIAAWRAEGPNTFILETSAPDSLVPFGLTWVGITHRGAWEAAGVPKHERVILLPLPEANTRVAALRSNQVDFIEAPPPDAVPSLRQAGFQIVTNTYPHTWTWHLSMVDGSPWRDIRVRRAANLAVDRAGMKTMLGDLMVEGAGLLPPGHPWHGRPSDPVRTDVAAARRLMAEAGFSARTPLRTKVAISPSGSGQMQPLPMNEAVQQNLKEIGIEIDFEVVEWNALLGLWREGARALAPRGITAINVSYSVPDPFLALVRFLKTEMAPPRANNWGFFSDPAYDAIMDRVYTTFDSTAQDALLAELHAKAVDDRLFLFVAHDLNPRAMSRRVQGFVQAQSWFQDLTPIAMR